MTDLDLVGDAETFVDVARELVSAEPDQVLTVLTEAAARRVPGAEHAGITQGLGERFRSAGATHQIVLDVDRLQYELDSGPCVDAIEHDETVLISDDLAADPRWPVFGRKAADAGVQSMMSFRLYIESRVDSKAALNLYSSRAAAFGQESRRVGLVLATHGALAMSAARARTKAANLEIALASNRDIGVAMGVLMALHKISRENAFTLLRMASQDTHRKLAEIALDVVETGMLPPRRGSDPA